MTLERDLESLFVRELKKAGGFAMKISPTVAGYPDRAVALRGQVHLVELKTETGRLSAAQTSMHRRITERTGVEVTVLRGAQEIRTWIRDQTPLTPDTTTV